MLRHRFLPKICDDQKAVRDTVSHEHETDLQYDLVSRTNNKVTLFTRPRRFGKTLKLSMMESFFDIHRDSRPVFDGLNIAKHPEFSKNLR